LNLREKVVDEQAIDSHAKGPDEDDNEKEIVVGDENYYQHRPGITTCVSDYGERRGKRVYRRTTLMKVFGGLMRAPTGRDCGTNRGYREATGLTWRQWRTKANKGREYGDKDEYLVMRV
jgi:hypothetical protein